MLKNKTGDSRLYYKCCVDGVKYRYLYYMNYFQLH